MRIAESFERIHRSNLIGMGVLPLEFTQGVSRKSLGLDGSETISIKGVADDFRPGMEVTLLVARQDGTTESATLLSRIDTDKEAQYYEHGGILQYVLRNILNAQ